MRKMNGMGIQFCIKYKNRRRVGSAIMVLIEHKTVDYKPRKSWNYHLKNAAFYVNVC